MMYLMFFRRPWIGQYFWLIFFIFSICSTALAGDISLGWDPEDGVAGYVVYYGTASGNYGNEIDLGTNTTVDIDGLQAGQTYYFAIASYDSQWVQSPLSAEISYVVPGILVLTAGTNLDDPMTLSFPEEPGHWYELQSSPDLNVWETFWVTNPATGNDWVLIYLFNTADNPQEFYRLIMH
jgi:hypothetical protein